MSDDSGSTQVLSPQAKERTHQDLILSKIKQTQTELAKNVNGNRRPIAFSVADAENVDTKRMQSVLQTKNKHNLHGPAKERNYVISPSGRL